VPRLVAAILLLLTISLFVEQSILRRRPSWLARWAFLPILRRDVSLPEPARAKLRKEDGALDLSRLEWPAAPADDEFDVAPPSAAGAGWVRVHSAKNKRFAGVARVAVTEAAGTLTVSAHYYPARLAATLGMILVLVAIILALGPWHVGLVFSAILVAMWLVPSLAWVRTARAPLTRAVDLMALQLEHPPQPAPARKKGRRQKG
jgi:hypothetical protein